MAVLAWAAGIVVVIGLAAATIWRIGALSQQPSKRPNSTKPDADMGWEEIQFKSGESLLAGWLLCPSDGGTGQEKSPLPTVIIAHGWGSNRSRVLRYLKPLYDTGYAVFMYDARSHGDSESIKAPSGLMFREDVLAAVDAARQLERVDSDRIAVLGHSLGGFGAVLALAKGLHVRAIVTDSMPIKFETMLRAQLRKSRIPFFPIGHFIPAIWLLRAGISRAEFREASIPEVLSQYAGNNSSGRTPVLMVHSIGDDFIPVDDTRKLERQLPPNRIETLFVNSDGHSTSEQDEAFWRKVLPFLSNHL
ncbi:MAG: alpha/beta hydrolase [Candidatus Pristimantibacillus sp.]